jgi:hypothetical protein
MSLPAGKTAPLEVPFKVLQDLFTPRFVLDPEFKPFDLRALRAEHPAGSSRLTNSPGMLTTKREKPNPDGKTTIPEASARFIQAAFGLQSSSKQGTGFFSS